MSNILLEKETYKFVHYAKNYVRQNVAIALADGKYQLTGAQWNQLAPIIARSIEEGYAQAYPEILKVFNSDPITETDHFDMPDSLIDVAGKMGQTSKRDFAAFTIVRNESFFLDLWCSYYGRELGEENLYVLDNSTDDGSVERAKARYPQINVLSVPSETSMRWGWCTNIVKTFQRICLRGYHVVVFSDADEYLVPEDGCGLRVYCERFLGSDRDYSRAVGWGVVHQVDTEPALDSGFRVLRRRNVAWRAMGYDKTLISKIPLDWAKGCHTIYKDGIKQYEDPSDQGLSLVHLRDVDVDLFFKRCQEYNRLNPSKIQVRFQAAADLNQAKEYMRTRLPPWNPSAGHEYQNQSRTISDTWRDAITT